MVARIDPMDDIVLERIAELERDQPGLVHVGTYNHASDHDRDVCHRVVDRLGASNVERQWIGAGHIGVEIVHRRTVGP
jgi:hypothetical protein